MRWFVVAILSLGVVYSGAGHAKAEEGAEPCGKSLTLADELRQLAVAGDPFYERRKAQEAALEGFREELGTLPEMLREFAARKETHLIIERIDPSKYVASFKMRRQDDPTGFRFLGIFNGDLLFEQSPSPFANVIFEFCEEHGLQCFFYRYNGSKAQRRDRGSNVWVETPRLVNGRRTAVGIVIDWAPAAAQTPQQQL